MSADSLSPPPTPDTGRSLAGTYVHVSCWYVLMVVLLYMLGLEGIYRHPFPFYAFVSPVFTARSLLAVGLIALVLILGAIGWNSTGLGRKWTGVELDSRQLKRVLAALVVFAIVFPAAVAMLRGGPAGISQAYERQAYEYIGDIGVGGSIRGLFKNYVVYHDYLTMHSKVHPPGPIAILWTLSHVAGRTPMGLSIATIVFGAMSIIPMFLWVREMFNQRVALTCAALYALVPSVVIFTATSADITFMPFTLTTLFLFYRALNRSSKGHAFAAGVLYGLLSLISFSLIGIGAFFGFVGLLRLKDPATRASVVQTAAVMIAGVASLHLVVWLWSGFNVVEVFQLSKAQFDTDQANLDLFDPRMPAWAWKFANPVCWFFFAGIPVSVLFLKRLRRGGGDARPLFWAIALTLIVLDLLYLARGEGERSAMYVMPFVVVPAGHLLDELCASTRSARPLLVTAVFLAVQSVLIESILYTYW